MRLTRTSALSAAIVIAIMGLPAAAEDRVLALSITAGPSVQPDYFGSDDFRYGVAGGLGFTGLRFGDVQIGDPDYRSILQPGTSVRGSFRVINSRDGKDELAGLDDVSTAVEAGVRLYHTTETWKVYADLRYGVIGHKSFVGELGADLIYRDPGGLVIHGGPRAEFGNSGFMRSYFGISPTEAANAQAVGNTNLENPYRPSSGVYSYGLELGAYQPLSADWGVSGSLRYDRLRGDAARSPIVQQGRRDQISAQIGLTRHFNLRF